MPPMVCFGWAGSDGIVSARHLEHYTARAKGGTGLIIIEAACVSQKGRLAASQLGLWNDEQIDGMSQLAARCHAYGAKVLAQIHHAGYNTHPDVSRDAIAPSDYTEKSRSARAMSLDELQAIQDDFVSAALRAEKAGLDGVEFHGAHGYLMSQFASSLINKRTDSYGGSFDNRMRFAAEIIARVKEQVSDQFILGYRMGANEPALEDGIAIAQKLEALGINLIHVSAGIGKNTPQIPEGFPYNWIVFCGTEIKKHVGVPVIAVNDIRTPERAAWLVDQDLADMTAIGRPLLVDPDWAVKAETGGEILTCLNCKPCQWFFSGDKCPRVIKRA